MKLGARMLAPNSTLNNLTYLNQYSIAPGATYVVMFQLVDLDTIQETNKLGNRYVPITGASLAIQIFSQNSANIINKVATQPFPADDRSIWAFPLSVADTSIMSGTNMQLTLTEGAAIAIGVAQQVLIVDGPNPYQC